MSEEGQSDRQVIGTCGWCAADAYERLIVSPKGARKRKTTPACDDHVTHFRRQGVETENDELARKHGWQR